MRLFVAVSPPPRVVDLLASMPRPEVPGLRWTTPEQWHVTLCFLGEVADPAPVAAALDRVRGPAQRAEGGGATVDAVLGPAARWFSGRQVLQVPVAGLDALAGAVADAVHLWTDEQEGRSFTGHVTLARMRGRERGPVALAGTTLEASWPVHGVDLVISTLAPGGSRYRVHSSVALR